MKTKPPTPQTLRDIIALLENAEHDLQTAILASKEINDGNAMTKRAELYFAVDHIRTSRHAAETWLEFCERNPAPSEPQPEAAEMTAARAAAVRAYGVDPVTNPA